MEVFAEFRAYFTGRIIGLGSSDGCLVGNFYGLLGLVDLLLKKLLEKRWIRMHLFLLLCMDLTVGMNGQITIIP